MAGSPEINPPPTGSTPRTRPPPSSSAVLISTLSARSASKTSKEEMRDQFTDLFKLRPVASVDFEVKITRPDEDQEGEESSDLLLRPKLLKQKRCEDVTPPITPIKSGRFSSRRSNGGLAKASTSNGKPVFTIGNVNNSNSLSVESNTHSVISADGKFNDMHLEPALPNLRRKSLFKRMKTFFSDSKDTGGLAAIDPDPEVAVAVVVDHAQRPREVKSEAGKEKL